MTGRPFQACGVIVKLENLNVLILDFQSVRGTLDGLSESLKRKGHSIGGGLFCCNFLVFEVNLILLHKITKYYSA